MQTAGFDGANLSGADLHGMDLRSTQFDGANLADANLSGANLRDASILGSNLRRSNLRNADLENAAVCSNDTNEGEDGNRVTRRLECARFDGADLRGANLRHVRYCVWSDRVGKCTAATAEMLREAGHADLSGALTP